jgi:hypothetical protein
MASQTARGYTLTGAASGGVPLQVSGGVFDGSYLGMGPTRAGTGSLRTYGNLHTHNMRKVLPCACAIFGRLVVLCIDISVTIPIYQSQKRDFSQSSKWMVAVVKHQQQVSALDSRLSVFICMPLAVGLLNSSTRTYISDTGYFCRAPSSSEETGRGHA